MPEMDIVPPRCIDIGLNATYKGCLGVFAAMNKQEQAKENERLHQRLHQEHTAHIHLDGSFDNGKVSSAC